MRVSRAVRVSRAMRVRGKVHVASEKPVRATTAPLRPSPRPCAGLAHLLGWGYQVSRWG